MSNDMNISIFNIFSLFSLSLHSVHEKFVYIRQSCDVSKTFWLIRFYVSGFNFEGEIVGKRRKSWKKKSYESSSIFKNNRNS